MQAAAHQHRACRLLTLAAHQTWMCRVRHWLDTLLWETEANKEDIYRMKGVLQIQDSDQQHVLQAVHELYDVVPGPQWTETLQRESRVVVIGRNLDHDALLSSFRSCCSKQQ